MSHSDGEGPEILFKRRRRKCIVRTVRAQRRWLNRLALSAPRRALQAENGLAQAEVMRLSTYNSTERLMHF
jgi:hypothetical protein